MHRTYFKILAIALISLFVVDVQASNTNSWLTDASSGVKVWSPAPVKGESVTWYGDADIASGHGVAIWAVNGSETERAAGAWKDGKLNAYGVWQHRAGDRYEGEWLNGKKHGFGVYTWPDGTHFCGAYRDGKRQGGIIYQADRGTADNSTPSAAERKQAFKAEAAAIKAREIAGKARRKMTNTAP